MKKVMATLVALCAISATANSMEGVFDRTEEIAEYLETMQHGTQGAATAAAKRIYVSGISDARLADAVNERLLKDYGALTPVKGRGALPLPAQIVQNINPTGADEEYGVWMVRALASFGLDAYSATFKKIAKHKNSGGSRVPSVRNAADNAPEKIEWHRRKNAVIATREHHNEGDDPRTSQLINLLLADELEYRRLALDEIYQGRLNDKRVYGVLEQQVVQYIELQRAAALAKKEERPKVKRMSSPKSHSERRSDNLIATNIKLLGLSGDTQYRAVMEKVLASDLVDGLKRHAQVSLDRLQ